MIKKEELSKTPRSFPVLQNKSHKGFKEKDAVKKVWDGVKTALEFIPTDNYFYFNSSISFYETILFIWFKPLVPSIPNLYPRYHHLILSI